MTDLDAKPWPPADKRRQPRAPVPVLRVAFDGGSRTFFGYAKNLSRSGLFVATISPREVGSRFEVEIPLPNPFGIDLRSQCEVVWRRKFDPKSPYEPGMGLRFLDLDPGVADTLAAWVIEAQGRCNVNAHPSKQEDA